MASSPNADSVKRVFLDALDILDPDEQDRFISSQTDLDEHGRGRVRALLDAAQSRGDEFLEVSDRERLPLPDAVGAWTVEGEIGRGGMSVVWLARDRDGRKAAIKTLRPELRTEGLLRRFALERSTLCRLAHESVAEVLDHGIDPDLGPWFALEYVDGADLLRWMRDDAPSLEERLEVFGQLCEAVAHAHARGFLHRDLKPGNVLVGRTLEGPRAKLIDFGLTRSLDDSTVHAGDPRTQDGQVVGTLEYMSPEQMDPDEPHVDERTDVWSLGVVLHELLTGELPYERRRYREARPSEVRRMLRRERAAPVSSASGVHAVRVPSAFDCLVRRALEPHLSLRLGSVTALAAEVRRFLAGQPLLTRAPSTLSRGVVLVREYRAYVVATGLLLLTLLAGLTGTLIGLHRAQQKSDLLAEAVSREGALNQRLEEQLATEKRLNERVLESLSDFEALSSRFRAFVGGLIRPAGGPQTPVREALLAQATTLTKLARSGEANDFALTRLGEPVIRELVMMRAMGPARNLGRAILEAWGAEAHEAPRDHLFRASLLVMLTQAENAGRHWDEALRAADLGLELLEAREGRTARKTRAWLQSERLRVLEARGDVSGALETAKVLHDLVVAEAPGDLDVMRHKLILGRLAIWAGDHALAHRLIAESRRLVEESEIDLERQLPSIAQIEIMLRWLERDWVAADALAAEHLTWTIERGVDPARTFNSRAHAAAARLFLKRDAATARALLDLVEPVTKQIPPGETANRIFMPWVVAARIAEGKSREENGEERVLELAAADPGLGPWHVFMTHTIIAEAWLAAGDDALGALHLQRAHAVVLKGSRDLVPVIELYARRTAAALGEPFDEGAYRR